MPYSCLTTITAGLVQGGVFIELLYVPGLVLSTSPVISVVVLSLCFYRWGDQGMERLSDLPKVTQASRDWSWGDSYPGRLPLELMGQEAQLSTHHRVQHAFLTSSVMSSF